MDVGLRDRLDEARELPARPAVRDLWPRILLSPLLGLTIPNVAGLLDHSAHSRVELAASYAFFIVMAAAIYEGNRRLYFQQHGPDTWLTRPWARLRRLLGSVVIYTVPVAAVSLGVWGVTTGDPAATWSRVATAVLLVVLATLMIVHIYETVFVLREWAGDRLRSERLQRQELETRIEALETEVDPHVLFNHLNSLSHLVDTGDPRARVFVTALAASYRALLRTRGRRLVPLSEELELLSEFRTLTAIRLGGALRISVAVSKDEADRWWLPPVVLPELVENAIKHNEASIADPLVVRISLCGDRLALMNPIRPKSTPMPSTGFGLRNLVDRFRLTTNRAVTYERREGMFRVMLPLIASDDQSGDAITDRPRIATARAGG